MADVNADNPGCAHDFSGDKVPLVIWYPAHGKKVGVFVLRAAID